MTFRLARGVALAVALTACAPAAAAERADYVTLRTAELLNLHCAALKYVEHTYLHEAVQTTLDSTRESLDMVTGAMSSADFTAWRQAADDEAAAAADAAGCTSDSTSYLLTARATASADIFTALLLAFHFNTLPADDRHHVTLPADQQATAVQYDAFLQQVYGESYPGFAEGRRQAAVASLPASVLPPEPSEGQALPGFGAIRTIDDEDRILLAKDRAARVLQRVEFEVVAETNGWLVKPLQTQSGAVVPALERGDGSAPGILLPVWAGPLVPDIEGEPFRLALARSPDGTIAVMSYGEAAARLAEAARVRLYVHGGTAAGDAGFREAATVFDAVPSTGYCLGGPCFQLPHAATVALLGAGDGAVAELVIDGPVQAALALRASDLARLPVQ